MDINNVLKNMNLQNYKDKFLYLKSQMGYTTNIVEIGAHYGEDSIRFHHFFPEANIYCFEPDPRNIEIFKKVCGKVDKIKLFPVAVSDKQGELSFYQASLPFQKLPDKYKFIGEDNYKNLNLNNSGSSSLKKSSRKDLLSVNEIKVQSIRLDEWDKGEKLRNIDLLWIDVQGAEKNVLEGCTDILNKIKFIHLEYGETHYEDAMNKEETNKFLENIGFQLVKDFSTCKTGDFLYKNKKYNLGLFFDIGSNIGTFVQKGLDNGYNKIISVEANNETFESLKNNFKNNPNVVMINKACSNIDNNKITFYKMEGSDISTCNYNWISKEGYRFKGCKIKEKVIIDTITLDNLINIYGVPELIKIDVEGYEEHVIKGLTKKVPKIFFEWTIETLQNTINILIYLRDKLNFNIFAVQTWKKGKQYEPFFEEPINFNKIIEQNIIKEINSAYKDGIKKTHGMIWVK